MELVRHVRVRREPLEDRADDRRPAADRPEKDVAVNFARRPGSTSAAPARPSSFGRLGCSPPSANSYFAGGLFGQLEGRFDLLLVLARRRGRCLLRRQPRS